MKKKTFHGNSFNSYIKKTSTTTEIFTSILLQEMFERNLIKQYKEKSCQIELIDGLYFCLGKVYNYYKWAYQGQGYNENTKKPVSKKIQNSIANNPEFMQKLQIWVPPITKLNSCLIENAIQKHLLLVVQEVAQGISTYYILAYLTTKKSAQIFHENRFRDFQKEQAKKECNTDPTKQNAQHIVFCKHLVSIPSIYKTPVKYGEEYLASLNMLQKIKLRENFEGAKTVRSFYSNKITNKYG